MKIALKMTGCKNNRYELDQVILWAAKNNAELVTDETKADFCVINTCTVTHVADKKSRQMIRKTKNQSRTGSGTKLRTIVFGCAARMQKKAFEEIEEIDYLVPNLKAVLELLEEIMPVQYESRDYNPDFQALDGHHSRSRALVQIQDGCDNYCAYCIIATARGRSKSRSVNEIIDEINQHVKNGYNEVVLTGINIGAYGCTATTKPDESKLVELLETILDKTDIQRIRLSSMGPEYFFKDSGFRIKDSADSLNDRLFKILQNPRVCRHIHLSVQSGSDSVLKRMRRNYTVKQMDEVIDRLKKDIPGIAITTDIIVGFPEETEKEFKETVDFVKRNKLAKAHVFPYSIRQGTLAAKMDQVSDDIKKKRAKKLQAVADKLRKEFIESQIGTEASVLWETEDEGLTNNYIRVRKKGGYRIRSISKLKLSKINLNPES